MAAVEWQASLCDGSGFRPTVSQLYQSHSFARSRERSDHLNVTTVEGDYRLFLARCNDGVPTVVFLGSMMPSRSLCLSESFAQSESLNVKTGLIFSHLTKFTTITPGLPRRYLEDCFDVFHIPSTCSSKTRRGFAHRTMQVRSADPQKFANQLSMGSMLRLWQFFLVVLTMFPAQFSRALNRCHVLFFKQNLDAFVIDSKTVYLEGLFVTAFATVSRSVLSSAGAFVRMFSRFSYQRFGALGRP